MTTYNDTCSICLDDFVLNNNHTSLKCGHTFHVNCIISSLRKSNECPNCRDTDGNPKLSAATNNFNFLWDDDDETDSYNEEYNDFENVMKELIKNNKEIKDKINNYKTNYKLFEKQISNIDKKYSSGLNELANNYLTSFRECPEFQNYNKERLKFQNKYNYLRKTIETSLSKNLDMETDQTIKDYIKYYLEVQIGEIYYFTLPRNISL
jgi:hypothetical protein